MTDRETRVSELAATYLPDELLERFRERADVYDRENRFFDEDLAELKECGYLTLFVPESHGGPGLSLFEVSRLQQRLASAAPGTALAINMHLMCTGVVKALADRGDDSLSWVFDEVMAGEIFAFGISEPSNDWVLQGSTTEAVPTADGGYTLTGVKIFTSLSPVWTRLIVHGAVTSGDDGIAGPDADAPAEGELVYGFIERSAPGITVSDDWDVLGMRASQSRATILKDVPMKPERVSRVIPAGKHPDLLTFAITSELPAAHRRRLRGSRCARALELGAAGLHKRKSAKAGTTFAEVPEARTRLADAHLDLMPVTAMIDAYARDFDDLVDHGSGWPLRLVGARIKSAEAARSCAETALMCIGGSGFGNKHELSRLFRDATAGLFHPPSADAARPMYAAALLDG
jgi:alkylation response protein AidB-like acyl-CoA dehydrogenase